VVHWILLSGCLGISPLPASDTSSRLSPNPIVALDASHASDLVCGPRCIHYILAEFGQPSDLVGLARETQWPDLEDGATLSSLQAALERRGVHTVALKIPSDSTLRWPYLAIVHYPGTGGSGVGHFAVWLPSSRGERIETWHGRFGIQMQDAGEFWASASRTILLTSPAPIDSAKSVLVPRNESDNRGLGAWFVIGCSCIVAACVRSGGCGLESSHRPEVWTLLD
jgi:hypothetical protein